MSFYLLFTCIQVKIAISLNMFICLVKYTKLLSKFFALIMYCFDIQEISKKRVFWKSEKALLKHGLLLLFNILILWKKDPKTWCFITVSVFLLWVCGTTAALLITQAGFSCAASDCGLVRLNWKLKLVSICLSFSFDLLLSGVYFPHGKLSNIKGKSK